MSTTLATPYYPPGINADKALKAAAAFWFTVAVIGQIIFAVSIALFYGLTALHGNINAWNKHLAQGYVAGDAMGNTALIAHIVTAVLITLSGAMQFMPWVRRRAPVLHRWNGRIYISTAFIVSLAGLYLLISRGPATTLLQKTGTGLLAILIMLCAAMALRYALKRDFTTHRRWALRLFLVVSSALFIRAGITLTAMILAGTGTFDSATIQGPILTTFTFGQYCVPLAVLEIYFWVQTRGGAWARTSMAAALVAITLVMGAGITAASAAIFLPNLRAAFDPRPSIAEALALTIKTYGVEAAIQQYHRLQAIQPRTYDFDEDELNALGYDLMHKHSYQDSIRILKLNTETYPKSGNTWDSLAEAYMDNGNTQLAIDNYHKSLAINPANHNAVIMLEKLGTK